MRRCSQAYPTSRQRWRPRGRRSPSRLPTRPTPPPRSPVTNQCIVGRGDILFHRAWWCKLLILASSSKWAGSRPRLPCRVTPRSDLKFSHLLSFFISTPVSSNTFSISRGQSSKFLIFSALSNFHAAWRLLQPILKSNDSCHRIRGNFRKCQYRWAPDHCKNLENK